MTNVVCDRGALSVVCDPATVIGLLASIEAERVSHAAGAPASPDTGNAASFLLRAEEILGAARNPTTGYSGAAAPPETYRRAWAVNLWAREGDAANDRIQRDLLGTTKLHDLDMVGAQRLQDATRRLLNVLLARRELQTAAVLDHARQYFPDFRPPDRAYEDLTLADELQAAGAGAADYCCYMLLDFVSADRTIQDEALRAALEVAGRLGLKDRFSELAQDELGVRKKQLERLEAGAARPG
jgi:hypothetical protein